jgi:hypothetical protein
MKKFILFAMLLFATCLASAAVFVADSPPCVKHELSINDNYTNNVNVIEFLRNTKVPEVTLITYSMAVPTSLFNYQNIATSQTVTVPSVTENSRSGAWVHRLFLHLYLIIKTILLILQHQVAFRSLLLICPI